MATFGYMFASKSMTSIAGGTCTMSVQVPGTFGGINPTDPANGRTLRSALVWADTPVAGDAITALEIVDTDGVVPVPVRAAFPNYPTIFDLIDTIGGSKSTIMLPPDPLYFESSGEDGNPYVRFIPSQLYLKMSILAAGLDAGKTFRIIVKWGAWQ